MSKMMGAAFYISWKGLGVAFDNIIETYDDLMVYISVPSSSENVDAHGNEMSGAYLAKRFKTVLTEMGIKNLVVKYKIRDEAWTKEKDTAAQLAAKRELFRSQA